MSSAGPPSEGAEIEPQQRSSDLRKEVTADCTMISVYIGSSSFETMVACSEEDQAWCCIRKKEEVPSDV